MANGNKPDWKGAPGATKLLIESELGHPVSGQHHPSFLLLCPLKFDAARVSLTPHGFLLIQHHEERL